MVVPCTLESNVIELHQFLFGDENYEPSSQVKTISNKILSDFSGGGSSGKKNDTEKTTEAPETTEAPSTETSGESDAYSGTGSSHEYWYPWETEGNDGATGPGRETRPHQSGQESWPYGESNSHNGSYPGESQGGGPGAETNPSQSESGQGSSDSGIIIYPGSGAEESQGSIPRPGTGQDTDTGTAPGQGTGITGGSGSQAGSAGSGQGQNGSSAYPGSGSSEQSPVQPGGSQTSPGGTVPGQNTDTGVIIGPGTGN